MTMTKTSTISEIIDADELAVAVGVSRRTIMRAAQKMAAAVYLGNKGYVDRLSVPAVLGKRYDPSVEKTGGHRFDDAVTLRSAAEQLGCSRSTVLRVLERTGLGMKIGGRRYVPRCQIDDVKAGILAPGTTRIHSDKEAMKLHARRMARASARSRRKAKKV